jgi:hypothetical protein
MPEVGQAISHYRIVEKIGKDGGESQGHLPGTHCGLPENLRNNPHEQADRISGFRSRRMDFRDL